MTSCARQALGPYGSDGFNRIVHSRPSGPGPNSGVRSWCRWMLLPYVALLVLFQFSIIPLCMICSLKHAI